MQQHNTWGKDRNDLASLAGQVITEGVSTDVTPLEDPSRKVEEIEDGEAPGGFDYFMSQLTDMKKDLDMGDSADSTIYQEIRHVAEQIMTWCDDQQA